MTNIYIDIETIPAPIADREFMRPDPMQVKIGNLKDQAKVEAKIAESISEWESGKNAALDPLQANVAMVGYAIDDGEYSCFTDEPEEAGLLNSFWRMVKSATDRTGDIQIIGHNIRFDASMLVHRSWINGIVPDKFLVHDLFKYDSMCWKDTMLRWKLGDRQSENRKLKDLCGAFGIPVKKSEVTGAEFYKFWAKDKEACIEYNRQDVEAVRQIWKRIGN